MIHRHRHCRWNINSAERARNFSVTAKVPSLPVQQRTRRRITGRATEVISVMGIVNVMSKFYRTMMRSPCDRWPSNFGFYLRGGYRCWITGPSMEWGGHRFMRNLANRSHFHVRNIQPLACQAVGDTELWPPTPRPLRSRCIHPPPAAVTHPKPPFVLRKDMMSASPVVSTSSISQGSPDIRLPVDCMLLKYGLQNRFTRCGCLSGVLSAGELAWVVCSGKTEAKWNELLAKCLNCHMVFKGDSYTWMYTCGLCFKHLFPGENNVKCLMSKASLQPKASVAFKFPLVCQLPAVSRDRGLSEAIATDFPFEPIQLVTCEITLCFLLAPFFPLKHHLIRPFFFFLGEKLDKK